MGGRELEKQPARTNYKPKRACFSQDPRVSREGPIACVTTPPPGLTAWQPHSRLSIPSPPFQPLLISLSESTSLPGEVTVSERQRNHVGRVFQLYGLQAFARTSCRSSKHVVFIIILQSAHLPNTSHNDLDTCHARYCMPGHWFSHITLSLVPPNSL